MTMQFPAFLQLRHEESPQARSAFLAEVESVTGAARRQFESSFGEIAGLIERATTGFSRSKISFDLDSSGLRQAAADAELTRQQLTLMQSAASLLTAELRAEGGALSGVTEATVKYEQALSAQLREATQAAAAAADQVRAYDLLQGKVDTLARSNQSLADSYRATFLEEARAANAASFAQQAYNAGAAPGLVRRASDNGATTSALAEREAALQARDAIDQLRQAEVGAAESSRILEATHRNTALEIGRVSLSARESADAFMVLVQARAAVDERAAQTFLNEAFGLERQAKSARESASAFQEMFAEEEKAARAASQMQAAATQLRADLDPMYAIQQRFNTAMDQADDLFRAGAISATEYGQAQALARTNLQSATEAIHRQADATKQGTNAQQNVLNSTRAVRTAYVQLGQQMQDVVVQAQMGTNAFIIFSQQVPQAAFALSGLANSANTTQRRIGQMATFLSGPWGAAIFAATAIMGPFIYSLIDAGDAADDAEGKTYDFSRAVDVLELSAGEATNAMRQLVQETRNAISVQGDFAAMLGQNTAAAVTGLEAQLATLQGRLAQQRRADPIAAIMGLDVGGIGEVRQQIEQTTRALNDARRAQANLSIARSQDAVSEGRDPVARARGEFDRAVADLNRRRELTMLDPITAADQGLIISEEQYRAEFNRLTSLKEAAEDAEKNRRASERDANKARREAERLAREEARRAREAEQLADFGARSAERVQRINEQFDEQPRLIDQAARATRELDQIMADLAERRPPGFEQTVDEARAAQGIIQDALVRPFQELREETERRLQIERLLTQGRFDEADALETIWRMEDRLGVMSAERRDEVTAIVVARNRELELLRLLQDQQANYLDATRSVRAELEAIFAGRGNLANFNEIFRDLQSRTTVEALFGDALRDLDEIVQGGGKLEGSVDYLASESVRAGDALLDVAEAASGAAAILRDPRSAAPTAITAGQTITPTGEVYGPEIMVEGTRRGIQTSNSAFSLSPERYFEMMTRRVAGPITSELDRLLGVEFFGQMQSTFAGALYGYSTAGKTGAVLGGAKGLLSDFGEQLFGRDMASTFASYLGGALQGAQKGQFVSGLAGAFGIKMSGTGSQIGGAIGSFLPIPGGDIIGSIAGGILGSLFSKSKSGSAVISGADSIRLSGSNSGRREGAGTLAGSVLEGLDNIVDRLDGQLGSFLVSIGTYKDRFRVNTTGSSKMGGYSGSAAENERKYGLYDFDSEEEAIAFALRDAISDGAVRGIRQSTANLLKAGSDLEKALQDALAFEDVFDRLARRRDPVGAAMDDLDSEFERLKDLFQRAGASTQEWADLEELYWLERDELIRDAMESSLGSLKGLMDDLTMGNSALSLRDRRSAALAQFNPLAARVEAGDSSAYDDFADVARQLLDIERQISGSQSGYFELLDRVTGLTQRALDGGAGASFADRDSPFGDRPAANDNARLIGSVDTVSQTLNDRFDALDRNMGRLIAATESNSGGSGANYRRAEAGW